MTPLSGTTYNNGAVLTPEGVCVVSTTVTGGPGGTNPGGPITFQANYVKVTVSYMKYVPGVGAVTVTKSVSVSIDPEGNYSVPSTANLSVEGPSTSVATLTPELRDSTGDLLQYTWPNTVLTHSGYVRSPVQ